MSIQKIPEKNTILFVWFNQYSGILLKTPTKTLAIDPVEVKLKYLKNIDVIVLTHEHYDHLDSNLIKEVQKTTNCPIIADPASAFKLKNLIPLDKLQVIRIGDTINIDKVTIKAAKCNHNARYPNTYIITSEDGVKIYHTADSLPFPEMAKMGIDEKFDIVFCSVGITIGASPESGFEIARLTKPPLAIPYHTNIPANQKAFQQLLKKELPRTACLIPEINKIYQISKKEKNP
ncbi:MAG: MBL fold metallo-hydrolase [Nitrososphaerota archaeon]|jgi:L-ascorbate metabolism protein UlaG (beta-lactamase superfamily)|nr:MBL fold metallo-hydrolase [Nitrososphaerota archaeon]